MCLICGSDWFREIKSEYLSGGLLTGVMRAAEVWVPFYENRTWRIHTSRLELHFAYAFRKRFGRIQIKHGNIAFSR